MTFKIALAHVQYQQLQCELKSKKKFTVHNVGLYQDTKCTKYTWWFISKIERLWKRI